MGIKNLLFKRVCETDSVNRQLETGKRATVDNEYYNIFISNCKKDLMETGKTICYYPHLKDLKKFCEPYYCVNEVDNYYIITITQYIVTLYNGKEKRYPITARMSQIKGEVLRYE